MPALGPVGGGGNPVLALGHAIGIRCPDLDLVITRGEVVVEAPLHPGVLGERLAQLGISPGAVDRDLDPGDTDVGSPGHAGDRRSPAAKSCEGCRSLTAP